MKRVFQVILVAAFVYALIPMKKNKKVAPKKAA